MSQDNMSLGNTKQGEIFLYEKFNMINKFKKKSPPYLNRVQDHFNHLLQSKKKHHLGIPPPLHSSFQHFHHHY